MKEPCHAIPQKMEELATKIVDATLQVHLALGPGLLESVYQSCLCHELSLRKIPFQKELDLPVVYKGMKLESGVRIDLLVDGVIILELKSVEKILPVHEAQLLTYLKLTHKRLGFLPNFNVPLMKQGIKRMIL